MIVIANYGMGNIGSIANMLKKAGGVSRVAASGTELEGASAIVLPGVGAFDHGMQHLESRGFREPLDEMVQVRRVPVLGICLGMQLMTEGSEEGDIPGLGWVQGRCERFRFPHHAAEKVPHMGWNSVRVEKSSQLFPSGEELQRFYFVHSYRLKETNEADILTTTAHGEGFVSGFEKENIAGFQFHPEKSHRFGLALIRRFKESVGC